MYWNVAVWEGSCNLPTEHLQSSDDLKLKTVPDPCWNSTQAPVPVLSLDMTWSPGGRFFYRSVCRHQSVPVRVFSLDLMSTPDETKPWFMKIRGVLPKWSFQFISSDTEFYGIPPFFNNRKRGLLIQGWHKIWSICFLPLLYFAIRTQRDTESGSDGRTTERTWPTWPGEYSE